VRLGAGARRINSLRYNCHTEGESAVGQWTRRAQFASPFPPLSISIRVTPLVRRGDQGGGGHRQVIIIWARALKPPSDNDRRKLRRRSSSSSSSSPSAASPLRRRTQTSCSIAANQINYAVNTPSCSTGRPLSLAAFASQLRGGGAGRGGRKKEKTTQTGEFQKEKRQKRTHKFTNPGGGFFLILSLSMANNNITHRAELISFPALSWPHLALEKRINHRKKKINLQYPTTTTTTTTTPKSTARSSELKRPSVWREGEFLIALLLAERTTHTTCSPPLLRTPPAAAKKGHCLGAARTRGFSFGRCAPASVRERARIQARSLQRRRKSRGKNDHHFLPHRKFDGG